MARTPANFLQCISALARQSGFSPNPAVQDLGLDADVLADVLQDWNQGYEEAYNYENAPWEDAWTSGSITPVSGTVTYAQIFDAAQFTLWTADPRTDHQAQPLRFQSSDAGMHLLGWTGNVYAFWKPAAPQFTFDPWVNDTAYAAGRVVLAADGQCYISKEATTGNNPVSSPAKWRLQPVLAVLTKAAQLMAMAEKHTREKNHGEAGKAVRDAENKLSDQIALEFPRVSSWFWIRRTN